MGGTRTGCRRAADRSPWVRGALARVDARLEIMKLFNWRMVSRSGPGREPAPGDASAANVFATETLIGVCAVTCSKWWGALDIWSESPGAVLAARLEQAYRATIVGTFGGGNNDILRELIRYARAEYAEGVPMTRCRGASANGGSAVDFELSKSQVAVRDLAREVLAARAEGGAVGDNIWPDSALWRDLIETGLLAAFISEDNGGQGLSFVEGCLLLEECGYARARSRGRNHACRDAVGSLRAGGSAEAWLRIARGEAILTVAAMDSLGGWMDRQTHCALLMAAVMLFRAGSASYRGAKRPRAPWCSHKRVAALCACWRIRGRRVQALNVCLPQAASLKPTCISIALKSVLARSSANPMMARLYAPGSDSTRLSLRRRC